MTTHSVLRVMSWLFLIAGIIGLGISATSYLNAESPAEYGVAAIGGTFWLICAGVAFFLRSRLG
jgi:hypothetical protein